jgi:hypothetical protein
VARSSGYDRSTDHRHLGGRGIAFGARAVFTPPMQPTILIIEPRPEVASALQDVVTSANYRVRVVPHLERLADVGVTPAAIIVRVAFEGREPAHAAVGRLPPAHPPVIAIAWEDNEVAEATRLKCDVVLQGARDVGKLCEVLTRVVHL